LTPEDFAKKRKAGKNTLITQTFTGCHQEKRKGEGKVMNPKGKKKGLYWGWSKSSIFRGMGERRGGGRNDPKDALQGRKREGKGKAHGESSFAIRLHRLVRRKEERKGEGD